MIVNNYGYEVIVLCKGVNLPKEFFDGTHEFVLSPLKKYLLEHLDDFLLVRAPFGDPSPYPHWEVIVEKVSGYGVGHGIKRATENRSYYRLTRDGDKVREQYGQLIFVPNRRRK
jgi:hypothetical protein